MESYNMSVYVFPLLSDIIIFINCIWVVNLWQWLFYSHAPLTNISVNNGLHIRRWSHNIIILTIMLQLPTVFSTVTCCTGL